MNHRAETHGALIITIALAWSTAAWWGCSASPAQSPTETNHSASSGNGGAGGSGGMDVEFGGSGGIGDDAGACVSTSADAHRITLDMIVLLDQSGTMQGVKWAAATKALKDFFNDPASAGIGAGMGYFPLTTGDPCDPLTYAPLSVPIGVLPQNAFALTNSMPAEAPGGLTPMFPALKGTLMAATAYQDAHPTHKVIVVLPTDGEPNLCSTLDDVADAAKAARGYNGVLTYIIAVPGAIIANVNKIAAAGGTVAAYDATNDINEFAVKMEEIRHVALGCEFEMPLPPNGQQLDPDKVNFSYTPQGVGTPNMLPRAHDVAECDGEAGWYYDSNTAPTKLILCPASCATVKADSGAKVEVLFGCESLLK